MRLFAGRMNRSTYLLMVLIVFLATLVLRMQAVQDLYIDRTPVEIVVGLFVVLLFIIWQFSSAVRRLHDCGLNGWLVLLILLPGVQLVLLLIPSNKGPNKYGPRPEVALDLTALLVDRNASSK